MFISALTAVEHILTLRLIQTTNRMDAYFLLAVFLSFAVVSCENHDTGKLDINIRVTEGQARFVQRIKSNIYENIVHYHNPKHNNILESHTMQDFNKGHYISCMPETQQCLIGHLDKSIYPDAPSTIENIAHMWNHGINSIDYRNTTKIYQNWIINGTEIKDLVYLHQSLRQFVTGFNFPLYPVTEVQTNSKVLTGDLTSIRNRRFPAAHQCRDGSSGTRQYAYTTGRCDYLYFCTQLSSDSTRDYKGCEHRHVNGRQYFVCVCCPGAERLSECWACSDAL
ncbi:uncharacterized protein LOC143042757 [Mytilus galloprovincialis]|uniref:uncharacterized protein LOC143042757 n=1 Tax=Mytilus galloprovincialis TaxID=29158 RepID=UPI003F7BFBF2